jgi:hypothetical protein
MKALVYLGAIALCVWLLLLACTGALDLRRELRDLGLDADRP